MTVYERIGLEVITKVIREFYVRAFEDPMIQHFFMGHDRELLTTKQITFSTGLLGGPRQYSGRPMLDAHKELSIRRPHFMRRQVLMAEVLRDLEVDEDAAAQWLSLEAGLAPVIVRSMRQKERAQKG